MDTGITAMVGGNGAGKTAALQALARIFGVSSSQRQVQTRDFHLRPDETELVSGATLSIECVLSFPELDDLDEDAAADAVPDCFNHMAATGLVETLKGRIRLQANWTDDCKDMMDAIQPHATVISDVWGDSEMHPAFRSDPLGVHFRSGDAVKYYTTKRAGRVRVVASSAGMSIDQYNR